MAIASIQQKREERKAYALKIKQLVESREGKDWTDDNQKDYDDLCNKIKGVDGEIERLQNVLDLHAAEADPINNRSSQLGISDDEANAQLQQENEIFNVWMRNGERGLTAEQQQFIANRAADINNALSTGTGADGGYLIPENFSTNLLEALKSFGGMRAVANVIRTQNGAAFNQATTDATSEEGEILAEGDTATDDDGDFGTKKIDAHMFSSKVITVPMQLLQDSSVDLEAHLRGRLTTRLGRITNRLFTVGTGVAQPEGIVTASAAGVVGATGSVADIHLDDLLALIHSVDPAYRESGMCNLMFNDATLLKLKQKKDSDNRPLWLPGIEVDAPDTIYGQSYVINQHMADMSANAKSILFGDMSHYTVRDVMDIQLFRFTDSVYTKKAQVGFMALMRCDGKLMDVGGAVKHYQNSAS